MSVDESISLYVMWLCLRVCVVVPAENLLVRFLKPLMRGRIVL